MVYSVPHFIDGKAVTEPENDARHKWITNPAWGEAIGKVICADQPRCLEAVAAAKQAWPGWAAVPPIKKARILFKFRDLLEKEQIALARLVTQEQGKTLEDAMGSVARAIEVVEFHCGLLQEWQGRYSVDVAKDIDCYTFRQPLGVCVGVSPFNFPVMVPVWMMIPAIACGNTFILKPSEQDPSVSIRLMELLMEAGLPAGVANCVQGDGQTVDYLLRHPDIAAITAVASTPVAEHIFKTAIAQGKRAHTFGGAKNHCIVMPDADFMQAAKAIAGAAYGSAGERCMAISVVVTVGEQTAHALLDALLPAVKAIKVDAGDVPNTDMGPLISAQHRQRVLAAIDAGEAAGASLLIDGRHYQHPQYPHGFFLGPTLFDHVTESMNIYQEEIFGPVLVMMRVNTLEEAIALINRNQYGNGTAIFTRDGYTARTFCQQVTVGMVGINIPIPVPVAAHPFGGWKRSAFGDTNMHGLESMHFYTKRKTVTSKWPVTESTFSPFNMPTHS